MLKVDKSRGEELTSVVLEDRNPEYFVDDYLGMLFYQPDKKTLFAYKLGDQSLDEDSSEQASEH